MTEPQSIEDTTALHKLLRADPQQYMRTVNNRILHDPNNTDAYFDRHLGWMRLGEPLRAIDDLNRVIEAAPKPVDFLSRGDVYRHLGRYDEALADYSRGEAMDPAAWQDDAFGLLFQADCHARLGDQDSALACCARLPDDFWTPGLHGAPSGGKSDIAEKLRKAATDAPGSWT